MRLSVVAALVGGWFLFKLTDAQAEHHPWTVGFVVALACGCGWFAWQLQDKRATKTRWAAERERTAQGKKWKSKHEAKYAPDRSWVAPVAILLALAAFGVFSGVDAHQGIIRTYCLYGSVSDAQLNGCMTHVSSDRINGLDTQAARFARGETSDCLDDAGPYCAGAAKWNGIEPPEPNN